MEFFNKKEEVIEVILTQEGRKLFSQGKFNPKYYSFHDTDIIYDNNDSEEQNNIVPRIKETPTLKSPTGLGQLKVKGALGFPYIKDKEYKLACEIGSKTYGDQYSPAWNINFLSYPPFQYYGSNRDNIIDQKKYEISFSSSVDYQNGFQELLPQFNIQTVYQVLNIKNYDKNKYSITFDGKQNYSFDFLYIYLFGKIILANYTKEEINNLSTVQYLTFGELKLSKNIIDEQKKSGFFEDFAQNAKKIIEKNYDEQITGNNFDILEQLPIENDEQLIKFKIAPLGIERYIVLKNFEDSFKEFYDNSVIQIINLINETLPVQLQTFDDFVSFMQNGLKTNYDYTYREIKDIFFSFYNLNENLSPFTVKDIFGNTIVFFDENKQDIKIKAPKLKIFQNQWLLKDPDLLVSFQELNTYEPNEFSEYELEYYLVFDKDNYVKLKNDELKKYINLYFDELADLKNANNIKNIYDSNIKADDTTC